jgi:cell division protein FtsW
MEAYRWARVVIWWDLPHHRGGVGYHVYGMLISLARGGVLGSGLGMSRDKWVTLPVPHTDSIFCVIGGELGLWGGLGVLALMTLLGVWAFDIARRSPHRLGWFLAAGSGLALTLQAFINIAVATAAIPVTGLTLPFISFGGTSLIACLASAGLVLAVAAERAERVAG